MKVILLAGGVGSRLWPLSTAKTPKQFAKIQTDKDGLSLFLYTYRRAMKLAKPEDIYVVTNAIHREIVKEQIESIGVKAEDKNVIGEFEGKNTLPAILFGTKVACGDEDDIVAVFPSDHKIKDEDKFVEILNETAEIAKNNIVTFGMLPMHPSTEFGYISPAESLGNGFRVQQFREKPDKETAEEFIKKGYFWNSGVFMFSSNLIMSEAEKYVPGIYRAVADYDDIKICYDHITEKLSIDYGIMEKTEVAAVVPMSVGWSDVGTFDAFYEAFETDEEHNICPNCIANYSGKNNLILTDNPKKVVMIDVEDLILVEVNGVLMVCKKGSSHLIKKCVEDLKEQNSDLI